MAFPTTSTLLDNFNRADANPIDGNWATLGGLNAYKIATNKAGGSTAAADNGAYYTTGAFGPDCDIFSTAGGIVSGTNFGVLARITNPTLTTFTGYMILMNQVSGVTNDTIILYRVTSGFATKTSIGTGAQNYTFANNDLFGIRCVGTTIEAWYAPAGVWNGTAEISVTDANFQSAGHAGLYLRSNSQRWDDFSGGTTGATTFTQALTVNQAATVTAPRQAGKVLVP